MSRGGRTACSLVVVAVSVAGAAAAWAAKLDKIACAELANELTSIRSTGIKADMERGPVWAMANMPPQRLESARRLMELEDQLEFRCAMRGITKQKDKPDGPGAPATPATNEVPASRAAEHPPPRTVPAAPGADKRTNAAPAMLAPVFKPPVALKPTHVAPAPSSQHTTSTVPPAVTPVNATPASPPAAVAPVAAPTTAPPAAPAATASTGPAAAAPAVAKPVQPEPVIAATPPVAVPPATTAPVTKSGPLPSAAAVPVPPATAPPAPGGAVPAAKKLGDPATAAARRKNPRRNPSSAYVSPGDVSPFALPGMRSR